MGRHADKGGGDLGRDLAQFGQIGLSASLRS